MIKIYIDNHNFEINAEGSGLTIVSEMCSCIKNFYDVLNEKDKGLAKSFKKLISDTPQVFFMSAEEICEETKKKREEVEDIIDRITKMKEILEKINELD